MVAGKLKQTGSDTKPSRYHFVESTPLFHIILITWEECFVCAFPAAPVLNPTTQHSNIMPLPLKLRQLRVNCAWALVIMHVRCTVTSTFSSQPIRKISQVTYVPHYAMTYRHSSLLMNIEHSNWCRVSELCWLLKDLEGRGALNYL